MEGDHFGMGEMLTDVFRLNNVAHGLRKTPEAADDVEFFVTLAVAGAKAHHFFVPFTARLKSCPDTKQEFFCSLQGCGLTRNEAKLSPLPLLHFEEEILGWASPASFGPD
jgi:hypothetical protein